MTVVRILNEVKILRRNPWLSGKLRTAVNMGLAHPKKDIVLATPPPWFGNPRALSDAQLKQILRFAKASSETKGKSIVERLAYIKEKASGPTGLAKPRVRPSKIGVITTIASERKITA